MYSWLFISNVDNVMRIKLVPNNAKLHPLLVLISVLGGIQFFGPLGFLFGPILMITFVTTLEIYLKYYRPELK